MLFWAPKAAFPPKVLGTFIFGTYLVVPGSKKKKKVPVRFFGAAVTYP